MIQLLALAACVTTKAPDDKVEAPPAQGEIPVAPRSSLADIESIAVNSSCAEYKWPDRGGAPYAYMKGMAITFAKSICKYKAGHPGAAIMAKAKDEPEAVADGYDALSWYTSNFRRLGLTNTSTSPDTIRHLYALGIGLGMRESSGQHCEGRDASAGNTSSETAEAGLFQTSWNAAGSSKELPKLMAEYRADPSKCLLGVFSKNVKCSASDARTYGSGTGAEFQKMAKSCPAFATEFAMITLRKLRRHYGPINTKAAEVRPECDDMLSKVQKYVEKNQGVCGLL